MAVIQRDAQASVKLRVTEHQKNVTTRAARLSVRREGNDGRRKEMGHGPILAYWKIQRKVR